MGTRADFYVGTDKNAEWLGSIAWDGYPGGIPDDILGARSEARYRQAVELFIEERDDGVKPEEGWPWPWDNSGTTDCAYAWHDNEIGTRVLLCWFGSYWMTPAKHEACNTLALEEEEARKYAEDIPVDFPDMSTKKRAVVERGPS